MLFSGEAELLFRVNNQADHLSGHTLRRQAGLCRPNLVVSSEGRGQQLARVQEEQWQRHLLRQGGEEACLSQRFDS